MAGLVIIINGQLGKRYLKERMLLPIVDHNELCFRYDIIEKFIENDTYCNVEELLGGIRDIERLQRRLILGSLHPMEFSCLYDSYEKIYNLIKFIKNTY